jgi:serine/threonine protein phosphatase 1
VRPGVPLASQSATDLFWIRDEFLQHRRLFEKLVVHGHTPVRTPDVQPNRINIDTGAYVTGQLTCLWIQGNRMGFL